MRVDRGSPRSQGVPACRRHSCETGGRSEHCSRSVSRMKRWARRTRSRAVPACLLGHFAAQHPSTAAAKGAATGCRTVAVAQRNTTETPLGQVYRRSDRIVCGAKTGAHAFRKGSERDAALVARSILHPKETDIARARCTSTRHIRAAGLRNGLASCSSQALQ